PVPPWQHPATSVASGPSALLTTGGVKNGPSLYRDASLTASALSSGVKSISSSMDVSVRPYAGGLVGIGCVGEYFSPGTSPWGTGFSSIGQMGWPVARSKTYRTDCLVGWATALTTRPLRVKSTNIGAHGMSQSQIPW